jgi:hypothetical protein
LKMEEHLSLEIYTLAPHPHEQLETYYYYLAKSACLPATPIPRIMIG